MRFFKTAVDVFMPDRTAFVSAFAAVFLLGSGFRFVQGDGLMNILANGLIGLTLALIVFSSGYAYGTTVTLHILKKTIKVLVADRESLVAALDEVCSDYADMKKGYADMEKGYDDVKDLVERLHALTSGEKVEVDAEEDDRDQVEEEYDDEDEDEDDGIGHINVSEVS